MLIYLTFRFWPRIWILIKRQCQFLTKLEHFQYFLIKMWKILLPLEQICLNQRLLIKLNLLNLHFYLLHYKNLLPNICIITVFVILSRLVKQMFKTSAINYFCYILMQVWHIQKRILKQNVDKGLFLTVFT